MAFPRPLQWRALKLSGRVAGALALVAGAALALQDPGKPAAPLSVTAVRHWSSSDSTRVAIEVSGEFEYRHDRLGNPDRIYFDIVGARPALASRQPIVVLAVGDGLLRQIRVSEPQRGLARVVLDLELAADFTVEKLSNPDRLMIELRRPNQAAPAAPPAAPVAAPEPAKPVDDRVPLPARKSNLGNRSLVRALGLKLERVVIDPGHGGHDKGTIGPAGLAEKDLVLDVARRLGTLIESQLGAEVIYTRSSDVYVPLEERTALANEKQADLFLSIHANAGVASAAGSETYYLNFTTSKSAMDVAARENASSERSIHELQSLIEKIALKDKVEESREFATQVQAALCADLARVNAASRDRGVRKAPFVVLVGAAMPSILTEVGFLSNGAEEKLLSRPEYRQKIAEAIYKGVSQYASSLSRFQVADGEKP
jgi:N-acetylmuramoyl-L-alanine amidase